MIDVEPLIVGELDRMLPLPSDEGADWDDVLGRTGLGRPRFWRAGPARWGSLAFAAVAASVVALLMVAPWQGGGSLVGRALAAVGQGPVLHVVIERPSLYDWYRPVDLTSGKPVPVTQRQEIWFDQSRDLKRTVSTLNGVVVDELVETPAGGFTPGGPVYTCAWIAAHPVEATKARVSCNANMENGTAPHHVPEQPPTLDLALAGFVDQYRSALASGQATQTGSGELDGHHVIWLRITTNGAAGSGFPLSEDVAIDASTYAPLLVRATANPSAAFTVVSVNTEPYDASLFAKPAPIHMPSIGETAGTTTIEAAQAPGLLGGSALWLGREWNGYRLIGTKRQELTTGYGSLSGIAPTRSVGVVFEYAPINSDGTTSTQATLEIKEATECELAYAMICGATAPSGNTLLEDLPFGSSQLRRDGLYVAISQMRQQQTDPVEIANALQPIRATSK